MSNILELIQDREVRRFEPGQIVMENGKVYRAKMFIDATYEGDLMAKAGVGYTVGREPNAKYGETLNGIRAQTPKHQFAVPVDPFVKRGDPGSGLLPFVQNLELGSPGAGDRSVQAYNIRLCSTRDPANRLPNTPPTKYDPANYELLARYLEALVAAGRKPVLDDFWNPIWMPNGKTDINNNGGFSTDFIGANYDYPEGDYATRARICQAHEDYVRGFVYFVVTSSRVPENMRKEMQTWGPARDEFLDTGGWPHQLYIREARRMISDYVMTEHNCRGQQQHRDLVEPAEPDVGFPVPVVGKILEELAAVEVVREGEGDDGELRVQPGSGNAVAPQPGAEDEGQHGPGGHDAPVELALHDFEALAARRVLGHRVIDEQARQVEQAGKPGDHEDDMQRLDPQHRYFSRRRRKSTLAA